MSDSRRPRFARLVLVKSDFRLLDQTDSLQRVIQNLKLLNCKVSVDLDYDAFDPDASGRERGHLESRL